MSDELTIKISRHSRGWYVTAETKMDARDWIQRTPYGPMSAAECHSLVCDLPVRFLHAQGNLFGDA